MSDTKTFTQAEERLAESLPGYTPRVEQQRLATQIENSLETGQHLLAEAGTGCIQGDALVNINRAGNGTKITLKTLAERLAGAPGRYQWDLTIPTYIQRKADDGTMRLAQVSSAWYSGKKQTFTVTTDSGRTLRATDEHPFLTERGWLRLDEIVVGDLVHVRGTQRATTPHQPKPQYLTRSALIGHPFASRRTAKRHAFRYPTHRLVAEAEANGLRLDDFIDLVRTGTEQDLVFLDPSIWAVHHKDHDHRNNAPQNLQVMTHSEHHRLHADEGKTSQVLYKVATEAVVSVEPYGVEDTYDVEVVDDPHNFVANGFVVHNTGKSLGYLIPGILSGKRVVVSTATKALQDQVASKDLPFLAEHLGVPFTYALLKGRSNYMCQVRAADPDVLARVQNSAAILDGVTVATEDDSIMGERDDFPMIDDADWGRFTTTSEECPGKSHCPFGEVCFAERAKAKAKASQVVVVNHALYMTDLKVRMSTANNGTMLGNHDAVIFDEAHEIEEYTGGVFGTRLTQAGVRNASAEAINWTRRTLPDDQDAVRALVATVQSATNVLWSTLVPGRIKQNHLVQNGDAYVGVIEAFDALEDWFAKAGVRTASGDSGRHAVVLRKISGFAGKFRDLVLGSFIETVRWVEDDKVRNGEVIRIIKTAPIAVDSILREGIFEAPGGPTAILTSATLTVGGKFEHVANRLGVDHFDSVDVGTPFDYGHQARIYIPGHLPDPTRDRAAWSSMVVNEMLELVRASEGRALLLFTSYAAMRDAYAVIAPRLPYTCLMQGQKPNKALAQEFSDDVSSVLFATRSFMTGVDIQGESCSLVVIDKLPFPVPTEPLTEARCERIKDQGGSDFGQYTIPVMTLILKQAFGRLIRHKNDRGVVAIMDPRLVTKGYGQQIVKSLPPAPVLTSQAQVVDFFAEIGAER